MRTVILQMTKYKDESPEQMRQRSARQIKYFEDAGFEVDVALALGLTDEEMIDVCRHADILYCNGNPIINRAVIENCPDLKLIQRSGIGVNSIDLDAATEHGIPVLNVAGYCIEELAVHATALILANLRTITFYDRQMRKGNWPKAKGRTPRRCSALTVGLYGLGGSGRYMAQIWGSGIGARIIACDPYVDAAAAAARHVELVDFDTLCRQSDILSIHVPLDASTYHAFNAEAFEKMRPNCIIANVSRGPIIDEAALAEALASGKITAAAIDTFEEEPLPSESPLLAMDDRTVLTPHSAYCGVEAGAVLVRTACTLCTEAVKEKTIYKPYLVNGKVTDQLKAQGYTIRDERLF